MKYVGYGFMAVFGLFLFLAISVGIGGCSTYNSLQVKDEAVTSQWSNVENVLQRRNDLIPNLVETVKGYASHEKDTLTGVIQARQQVNNINLKGVLDNPQAMQKLAEAEGQLSSALSRLLVVIEKYPELKADAQFMNLQHELAGTENRIAEERRRFNLNVQSLNSAIRVFPNNLVASFAGITPREYFKADDAAKTAPKVKF